MNKKRVHRIWKGEGLQIPRRRPRKRRQGPKGEVVRKAQYSGGIAPADLDPDTKREIVIETTREFERYVLEDDKGGTPEQS